MRLYSISGKKQLLESNFSRRSFLRGVSGLASMGLKPLNALSALSGGGGGYDVSKLAGLVRALTPDKIKLLHNFMFNHYGPEARIVKDVMNADFRPLLRLVPIRGKLHYYADQTCLTGLEPSSAKRLAFAGFFTKDGMLYYDELGDGNPVQVAPLECALGMALDLDSVWQGLSPTVGSARSIEKISREGFKTEDLQNILLNLTPEFVEQVVPGFLDDCINQIIRTEGKDALLSGMKEVYHEYSGDCRDLLKASGIFRSLLDVPDNFDTATMASKLVQHGFMDQNEAKLVVDVAKKYGDKMNEIKNFDKLDADQKTSENLKRRFAKENEANIEKERQESQRLRDKEAANKKRSDDYDDYLKSQMSWESGIGESRKRLSLRLQEVLKEGRIEDNIANNLIKAINKLESDLLYSEDDENDFDQESLKLLQPLKQAIEYFKEGYINIDKVLDVASEVDKKLDQGWGYSIDVYGTVADASRRDTVSYQNSKIGKIHDDNADIMWAIVIPGYSVRDTIYTILDEEPNSDDISRLIDYVTSSYWEIDPSYLWNKEDYIKDRPPTLDKDEWDEYIRRSATRSGSDLRGLEANWLMHPSILHHDCIVTKAYILSSDALENGNGIIWDTSKQPSKNDMLGKSYFTDKASKAYFKKHKPAVVIGNYDQYMENFNSGMSSRLITGGKGDPWYISQEEIAERFGT